MLNYNELKYIATKMAEEPELNEAERIANMFRETRLSEEMTADPAPDPATQIREVFDPAAPAAPAAPSFMDKLKGFGKEYGGDIGMGAGAGAIAGIPIALLAHALMADPKNKGLRGYLKSGLLGALLGGGLGAVGGGMLRPNTRMNLHDQLEDRPEDA